MLTYDALRLRAGGKPVLLDGCCKAGGAGYGYKLAGFYVVGVDIEPQKRYAGHEFYQADILEFLGQYGWMFDAIHCSPPCEGHSRARRLAAKHAKEHLDLIPHVRFMLKSLGIPYVIENVKGAPLRDAVKLCGCQFPELRVYRDRYFESSIGLLVPQHFPHNDKTPPAGRGRSPKGYISITSGGITGVSQPERFAAMGIDWMTNAELSKAVPPAYTRHIGWQLMNAVLNRKAMEAA